jgi:dTDP-4-amino-4,6-dideoxygalactose transaminase
MHTRHDAGDPQRDTNASRIQVASPNLPDFDALLPQLRAIWASGELTNGQTVSEFERRVGMGMPGREVIAVNSCTTGLMLTLRALGVEGEVLLPSFTFTATAHAVVWAGCVPVFVDCNASTLNVDVDDLRRKITPNTSAIVAVYVSGNPPALEALEDVAREHDVKLVLDAAHALGATFKGRPSGTFGDAEVFSLSPTKTITTFEGGIVSVRDAEIARRMRIGRNYGNPGNYDCEFVGLNARMSEIHALVGLQSYDALQQNVEARRRLASLYTERLGGVRGILVQSIEPGNECSFKDFSMRIVASEFGATRDEVRNVLERHNIETRAYFDPPVHRQAAYRKRDAARIPELPTTDAVASEILNLPLHVGLSVRDIERIVQVVKSISAHAAVSV